MIGLQSSISNQMKSSAGSSRYVDQNFLLASLNPFFRIRKLSSPIDGDDWYVYRSD
jgi:hypothetical protein